MTTTIKKQNTAARPGYKHTPLGWIPEEWGSVNFEDALSGFSSGSTPSRARLDYFRGEILWITSGELNYNVINDTKEKVSLDAVRDTNLKILEPGTFLMAITGLEAAGTRGSCAIVGSPATTNQSCMALTPKRNLVVEYLFQYYVHFGERLAFKFCQGTKQQSYNGETARKLPLLLPPLPEQRKIAAILSTWDDAIQQTQALITQLQKRNKGLAQQLLKPKKEWKVVKLSDLFDRITDRNEEGNDNVVTISAQRGFVKQETFFKKRVASDTLLDYFLVNRGDFCYNKSYSTGYDWGATKRLNDFDKAVVTTLYICFRIKNEQTTSGRFFEHFFESGILDKGLSKIAHEGGRAHGLLNVTPSDFFSLKISVPDIKEQDAIASVLDNANKELKQQQEYLNTLQVQKKGLMQQLLTGAIRVKIENKKM